MKKTIIRLAISNFVALAVFYGLYSVGASNLPAVQQYYLIPLALVVGYIGFADYKEIRKCNVQYN